MYGTPEPVEGCCNAHLYIADDYGDNSATVQCGLSEGHEGAHKEVYKTYDEDEVVITWGKDQRERCVECGTPDDVFNCYDAIAADPEDPEWTGVFRVLCEPCCVEHYPHIDFSNPYAYDYPDEEE